VKEKVKQLMAEQLIRKSHLKITLRNLSLSGDLTEEKQNALLDDLKGLDEVIQKLQSIYKSL
jgi:hypothetical protein